MGAELGPAETVATPFVSIVIACRNERDHIGKCLDSLLNGIYPKDCVEFLVVDGMSDDGTRELIEEYSSKWPQIRLVDNPRRITPCAFNVGILAAKGEFIAIVGAHAAYDCRYLSELMRHILSFDADLAGAVARYVPRDESLIGKALAVVASHRFGAGANAGYKVGVQEPTWVDTVSSGCYRKDVFARVGLFDERLIYSQDIEFNSRLRRAGGRILLVPSAKITYLARSDVRSFLRHAFRNGEWVLVPLAYTAHVPMSWRHFVPMAFVGVLMVGTLSLTLSSLAWVALVAVVASYALANAAATLHAARVNEKPRLMLVLPPLFAMLHLTYGLGSWWGLLRLVRTRLRRERANHFVYTVANGDGQSDGVLAGRSGGTDVKR